MSAIQITSPSANATSGPRTYVATTPSSPAAAKTSASGATDSLARNPTATSVNLADKKAALTKALGGTPQEVQIGHYGKQGEIGTIEEALRKGNYTLQEIYAKDKTGQTLADRVAKSNGLERPQDLMAGSQLFIPAKPKPSPGPADKTGAAVRPKPTVRGSRLAGLSAPKNSQEARERSEQSLERMSNGFNNLPESDKKELGKLIHSRITTLSQSDPKPGHGFAGGHITGKAPTPSQLEERNRVVAADVSAQWAADSTKRLLERERNIGHGYAGGHFAPTSESVYSNLSDLYYGANDYLTSRNQWVNLLLKEEQKGR